MWEVCRGGDLEVATPSVSEVLLILSDGGMSPGRAPQAMVKVVCSAALILFLGPFVRQLLCLELCDLTPTIFIVEEHNDHLELAAGWRMVKSGGTSTIVSFYLRLRFIQKIVILLR